MPFIDYMLTVCNSARKLTEKKIIQLIPNTASECFALVLLKIGSKVGWGWGCFTATECWKLNLTSPRRRPYKVPDLFSTISRL